MSDINKTSLLIPSQLPPFIAEDVNASNFVAFLQAYYEWMEQSGIIISLNIINGGLGYTNPIVTITGDGTGATATATVNDRGVIDNIIMTSYGSGYTNATVTITGSCLVPASVEAIIQNGITTDSKKLLNYMDVDNTTKQFLDYFIKDFMPYFPADAVVSKDKAIKFARQIYNSKGTPASYKLFFRLLYDSDFEYFNTGDLTLKASGGEWFVPRSLLLLSTDTGFLEVNNYRIFGETSKSFASIENVILGVNKVEVFIADIERLFQSGEFVRVVDNNNQDVIINGSNLRAKVVGQISSMSIDPNHKGLNYSTGDPVIFYGGLNDHVASPIGATALVGDVTSGSIQSASLLAGGQGYNLTLAGEPTSVVTFSTSQAPGYILPSAIVSSVDTANAYTISGLNTDTIGYKLSIAISSNNYHFANGTTILVNPDFGTPYNIGETVYQGTSLSNATFFGTLNYYDNARGIVKVSNVGPTPNSTIIVDFALTGQNTNISLPALAMWTANANSRIMDVLSTTSFTGYPLSGVFIASGGSGLKQIPQVDVVSEFATDNPSSYGTIGNLGILGPVKIVSGGDGYQINDEIVFTGGSGFGASAFVANVDANGAITDTTYISANSLPSGGLGYSFGDMPMLSVVSANANAANAIVTVDTIMGQGADIALVSTQIGQIKNFNIISGGEDYISSPTVSLRVQDIAISNVSPTTIPQQFDSVYQGTTYISTVYSINQLGPTEINPLNTIYRLRVFNYTTDPNPNLPLVSLTTGNNYKLLGSAYNSSWSANGIINYGSGSAEATVKYLNGLRVGTGQYLSTAGQLSSFDVIQSSDYNSYTYKITTEKEIERYRTVLLNMLHPSGTKLLGRFSKIDLVPIGDFTESSFNRGNTLYHYSQTAAASASMFADLTTTYSDTVKLNNLPGGTNIATFIFANSSTLLLESDSGQNVISMVTSVDSTNNIVKLQEKTFLTYPNTFNASWVGNTNIITIDSPTGNYMLNDAVGVNAGAENFDLLVLNEIYGAQTPIPLQNLLIPGDYIYADNITRAQVQSIDYDNEIIYLNTKLSANGGISNVDVLYSGLGYDNITLRLNITGDGSGANLLPILDSSGRITEIKVIDTGYNYNTASVSIDISANYHTPAVLGNTTISQVTTSSPLTFVRNYVVGGSILKQNQIKIYGPSGTQYFPQLADEYGDLLLTENGLFILLG